MGSTNEGGCLCGAVRYKTTAQPQRVTVCHCSFCQKVTGTAFLVEPIFLKTDVVFSGTAPKAYDHRSDVSGKRVAVNFCGRCGSTLFLDLERFPTIYAIFAGTFDDPNWFDRGAANTRHIFTQSIQRGVVLPAGIATYEAHALQNDGTPNTPTVFAHAIMPRG
jgi:hypothetical protein